MTEYGRIVRIFMADRHVKSLAELHRLLVAGGYDVGYGQLYYAVNANWGRTPEPELNRGIAHVLRLTEEEKIRLARTVMAA
jgi:hypothetical protein